MAIDLSRLNISLDKFNAELVGRILAHLDEIEGMVKDGTLTKESFCDRFLTDIPGAAGMTMKQMADAVTERLNHDILPNRLNGNFAAVLSVSFMMQSSGCTIDEAVAAVLANKTLPSTPYIADKVAALCGNVHPAQLNAVYFALTQACSAPVVGAFTAQGINTTEHMPLTYTLSKNAETGAVTVHYSEPVGFPVKFHWETTIDLN